jgi:hypothetical protein
MATDPASKLPPPPADIAARPLPVRRIRALFRIHRSVHACFYFSKNGDGRFDDPLGKYGVLYAALKPEAAFAEVFLRQLSQLILPESDLDQRTLSEIGCKSVDCVDLTASGLRRLSCDNRIATEKPYRTTGLWSRAIFEHPQKPAGIIYLSRHNPRFKCVALFDTCCSRLTVKSAEPLMQGSRRAWTIEQINQYKLALQP